MGIWEGGGTAKSAGAVPRSHLCSSAWGGEADGSIYPGQAEPAAERDKRGADVVQQMGRALTPPAWRGAGGDISTPSLSHRSAKAGPGDKSGTGMAGGWGACSLQRGLPCPAWGCTRTTDRQTTCVQPHGEIRSRECLVLILSVSAISQSAAIVYGGILCSAHK